MLSRIFRFVTLIGFGFFAVIGYAASGPSTPAPALSSVKPMWPDNGIAQRRFKDGGVMFVEDDHGTRRAWVLSNFGRRIDTEHGWAEALDFFSGKVMKVKVGLTEDGHESRVFTAPDGTFHFDGADQRFRFSGVDMMRSLPGLDFNGGAINMVGKVNGCFLHLDATASTKNWITGQVPTAVWRKYPIYHLDTGSRGCPSGFLHSMIGTALDLGDGTFLASEGCFVFRLRRSDLSPVGAAPALRVVDANGIDAAFAKLRGKTIDNPTGYLIKALHLPTSPELSCKAN
jgi:hypothetical protein